MEDDKIQSGSIQRKLEASQPVNQGWTNRVYQTPEDTIIKVFSQHFIQALIFSIIDAAHGKFNLPYRKERLQKEVDMKDSLREKGFQVPRIIEVYNNAIEMEKVEDKNLAQLMDNSSKQIQEIGSKIGELIKEFHAKGFSLGDATFQNFYLNDETVYTIDHEYGSTNSDFFDKERDVIHILSDSFENDREKYLEFRKGFESSYRPFNKTEILAAALFSLFTSLINLDFPKMKKTVFNVVRTWKEV